MTNTTSTAAVESVVSAVEKHGDFMRDLVIEAPALTAYEYVAAASKSLGRAREAVTQALTEALEAAREEGRAAGRRDAPLREAAEIILTRIESAHIDDWKENDVDWFAIERLRAALTTPTETKPTEER